MDFTRWISDARTVMTLLSLLTFIGIMYWAFIVHHKQDFDEAAMLPFADDDQDNGNRKQEPNHG
jgi:cytochrome c oxidase cbb3-type subunit 4